MAIRSRILALFLLGLTACAECAACGGPPAVAELVHSEGRVERDWQNRLDQWTEANVGAAFGYGDGLKTGVGASATAKLVDGSELKLESETLVRFLTELAGENQAGLEVVTGQALVAAEKGGLRLRTRVGMAVLEGGTKLRITPEETGHMLEVMVGAATIETEGGETRTLGQGDTLELDFGGAIIEEEAKEDAGIQVADAGAGKDAAVDAGQEVAGNVVAQIKRRPVRARAPGESADTLTRPGEATWAPGTRVRVSRGGTVSLTRGTQQATVSGPAQFVVGPTAETLVQAESGRVSFHATDRRVRVEVPGGAFVAVAGQPQGTRAHAMVRKKFGASVQVDIGTVEVVGRRGTETLGASETATLRADGVVEFESGRGPERADFLVPAGESMIVRDPRPPTALGFRFGKACPAEGVVQLIRRGRPRASSTGTGSANLLIPRGSHNYRVRCMEDGRPSKVVAQGRVTVVRDSGMARLPSTPPPTLVDTDGRKYNVLFQNLLPSVSVRWPKAPAAGSYVLKVDSERGEDKAVRSSKPRYTFESGALGEGRHFLSFETGAGRHSETTTLVIRFDNVAPKASVREPQNGTFQPGQTVTVSGVALPGWRVSVAGTRLPLDNAQRFTAKVTAPKGQNGIAIRIAHPKHGVHYYVRRAGGK